MTAYDNLPAPMADVPTLDQQLANLREDYSSELSSLVDDIVAQLILPEQRVVMLSEIASFTTYFVATLIVRERGQALTRENLMAAYWPMQKALKDDVPGMLRQLADAAAAAPRGNINDPI